MIVIKLEVWHRRCAVAIELRLSSTWDDCRYVVVRWAVWLVWRTSHTSGHQPRWSESIEEEWVRTSKVWLWRYTKWATQWSSILSHLPRRLYKRRQAHGLAQLQSWISFKMHRAVRPANSFLGRECLIYVDGCVLEETVQFAGVTSRYPSKRQWAPNPVISISIRVTILTQRISGLMELNRTSANNQAYHRRQLICILDCSLWMHSNAISLWIQC